MLVALHSAESCSVLDGHGLAEPKRPEGVEQVVQRTLDRARFTAGNRDVPLDPLHRCDLIDSSDSSLFGEEPGWFMGILGMML